MPPVPRRRYGTGRLVRVVVARGRPGVADAFGRGALGSVVGASADPALEATGAVVAVSVGAGAGGALAGATEPRPTSNHPAPSSPSASTANPAPRARGSARGLSRSGVTELSTGTLVEARAVRGSVSRVATIAGAGAGGGRDNVRRVTGTPQGAGGGKASRVVSRLDTGRLDATLPDATLPDATLPDATLPDSTLPDTALLGIALLGIELPGPVPPGAMPDPVPPEAPNAAAASPFAPTPAAGPSGNAADVQGRGGDGIVLREGGPC